MNKYYNITPDEFKNITEDDLLFITFPGRMGDEYGCTLVIKNESEYSIYRIEDIHVFGIDVYNQFPGLSEALKNQEDKESDKYKAIYMGYGNLLFVNKSIYDDYKKYLDEIVNREINELKENNEYDKSLEDYYPVMLCFKKWETALNEYLKDNGFTIK